MKGKSSTPFLNKTLTINESLEINTKKMAKNISLISLIITAAAFTTSAQTLKPFSDMDDKWGYQNESYQTVIPCQFEAAKEFSEGMAAVRNKVKVPDGNGLFQFDYLWGYINLTGKIVIPCQYSEALIFLGECAVVAKGNKYALIDKKGKAITPFKYDEIAYMAEELTAVNIGKTQDGDEPGLWGFIDKTGKEVIPLNYYKVESFSEYDATAKVTDQNFETYYIDTKGICVKK